MSLTQFSAHTAISGYVPSKGTATTPVTINAIIMPVVTDDLIYLFEGAFDEGEVGMIISSIDTTEDINTGDRITYNSINYKVMRVVNWHNIGNIKAYTLKRATT